MDCTDVKYPDRDDKPAKQENGNRKIFRIFMVIGVGIGLLASLFMNMTYPANLIVGIIGSIVMAMILILGVYPIVDDRCLTTIDEIQEYLEHANHG